MRIVLQRVLNAEVEVEGEIVGKIGMGILIFLGIVDDDTDLDIEWLVNKVVCMRIFNDDKGVMNKSLMDVKGDILVVSQFTLHASTKKGNRPSYIKSANSDFANQKYCKFIDRMEIIIGRKVQTGVFGANMQVSLLNNGPVTIIVDSKIKE